VSSERLVVLCVIAKDAVVKNEKYCAVGPDMELRIREAVSWQQTSIPLKPVVWAFGAGTDQVHANGPTLATLSEAFLRQLVPGAMVVSNSKDKEFFGTYEEITWIIWEMLDKYQHADIEYVFFTQAQHMDRVKRVLREFYPEVRARFVLTREVSPLSPLTERLSHLRLTLLKWGVVKPRFTTWYDRPTAG
jgi:hypothetical protein